AASASTVARPMPRLPPVTRATRRSAPDSAGPVTRAPGRGGRRGRRASWRPGGEALLDGGGPGADRGEGLPPGPVALDADLVLLLESDYQLQRVHGVETEPVSEQRRLVADVGRRGPLQVERFDDQRLDPGADGVGVGHGAKSIVQRTTGSGRFSVRR